jgi:hypothetical protein
MELMDSFQKEALMRSAQQIINENGESKGTKVVSIKIHENSENLNVGSKNIIWVYVFTNDSEIHDYAITGWRYLKNLNDVIVEHREERMKELGI